ncbi:MAG: hypothetical protein IT495_20865 [Gammaproteobacteria bacterium]|nr:hypothetical protein [Gammaproteobacteria bacterium]
MTPAHRASGTLPAPLLLWGVFVLNPLLLAAVTFSLDTFATIQPAAPALAPAFEWAVYAGALPVLALVGRCRARGVTWARAVRRGQDVADARQALVATLVFAGALADLPATLGLVHYLLGGTTGVAYAGCLLAFTLAISFKPPSPR